MKVEIKDKHLIVTIPIEEKVSASGKSLVIASSKGNKATDLKYKGKTVTVGLNAYTSSSSN